MRADTGVRLPELRVDGGASTNDLLLQIQADLLGVPVVRSRVSETTALGAALLAGLGVGALRDRGEVAALCAADRRFEPRLPRERAEALRALWARAVERARGWAT
jgi:glycerol kinase